MIITNCTWELHNLDCRALEIGLEGWESIDEQDLNRIEEDYDYIVVKVKPLHFRLHQTLSASGHIFIENQITVRHDFGENKEDFPAERTLLNATYRKMDKKNDLERILEKMSPEMFTTDRIYLDPNFGKHYSLRRYRNWMRQEFARGTQLYNIVRQGEEIGFVLFSLSNNNMNILLWGLFEPFQHKGLGDCVPMFPFWYHKNVMPLRKIETKVSSNNKGILVKLEHWGYQIAASEYVFVKHL